MVLRTFWSVITQLEWCAPTKENGLVYDPHCLGSQAALREGEGPLKEPRELSISGLPIFVQGILPCSRKDPDSSDYREGTANPIRKNKGGEVNPEPQSAL